MSKSLAIALSKQRMRECINLNEFANEMQTTYPRHLIQDFMCYVSEHNHHEMFRYAWLEVFCYWKSLTTSKDGNTCESCDRKMIDDEWPKEVIRFCDYCTGIKE